MQIDHFFKEEAIAHLNVLLSCGESIDETMEMGRSLLLSIQDSLKKSDFAEKFPERYQSFENIIKQPSTNVIEDFEKVISLLEDTISHLN